MKENAVLQDFHIYGCIVFTDIPWRFHFPQSIDPVPSDGVAESRIDRGGDDTRVTSGLVVSLVIVGVLVVLAVRTIEWVAP